MKHQEAADREHALEVRRVTEHELRQVARIHKQQFGINPSGLCRHRPFQQRPGPIQDHIIKERGIPGEVCILGIHEGALPHQIHVEEVLANGPEGLEGCDNLRLDLLRREVKHLLPLFIDHVRRLNPPVLALEIPENVGLNDHHDAEHTPCDECPGGIWPSAEGKSHCRWGPCTAGVGQGDWC